VTGIETGLLTAAAVAVAFWPKLVKVVDVVKPWLPKPVPSPAPVQPEGVSYQDAMVALATVRSRLVSTGGPSDKSASAIVQITQDLVAGSDK
jgi:hypothetical protein